LQKTSSVNRQCHATPNMIYSAVGVLHMAMITTTAPARHSSMLQSQWFNWGKKKYISGPD